MKESGKQLIVTGVNFRNTTLEIRNKFALTTENIRNIYEDNDRKKPEDFFILSTCNRTEIYSITENPDELKGLLTGTSHMESAEVSEHCFNKSGDEAVKHLFNVASGLESQILGDREIIGQLKNAFVMAKSNNCVSGLMEKYVNTSLQASRQVRKATTISDGTTSISYAVIQYLKKTIGDKDQMNICLMGLGKIGLLTLKNLKDYLPQHNITLINRNEIKARSAAEVFGVNFVNEGEQEEVLKTEDVLIVATGADHPIISKEQIENSGIRLLFDLSVPSNVAEDVKTIPGLQIYNINDLSLIVNETISNRSNQIPVAEKIVDEHITELNEWIARRALYLSKENINS